MAATHVFGIDRTTVVRPGVILGPREYSGRLTWWLDRCRRGGDILAPGGPDRVLRPVDVRDAAEFVVALVTGHYRAGAYNVVGPDSIWGQMFADCIVATRAEGRPVWVDDDWLVSAGVEQCAPGRSPSSGALQSMIRCRCVHAPTRE